MKSRRQVLRAVAGATVLPVLSLSAAPSSGPKVLQSDEMRRLSVLVDLIIKRKETPSATDAGVPAWLDEAFSADVELLARTLVVDCFLTGHFTTESAGQTNS